MGGISVHAEQLLNWILIIVTSSGWLKLLTTHLSHYAKCSLLLGTSLSVRATVMREETQRFLRDLDVSPKAPTGMDCTASSWVSSRRLEFTPWACWYSAAQKTRVELGWVLISCLWMCADTSEIMSLAKQDTGNTDSALTPKIRCSTKHPQQIIPDAVRTSWGGANCGDGKDPVLLSEGPMSS